MTAVVFVVFAGLFGFVVVVFWFWCVVFFGGRMRETHINSVMMNDEECFKLSGWLAGHSWGKKKKKKKTYGVTLTL